MRIGTRTSLFRQVRKGNGKEKEGVGERGKRKRKGQTKGKERESEGNRKEGEGEGDGERKGKENMQQEKKIFLCLMTSSFIITDLPPCRPLRLPAVRRLPIVILFPDSLKERFWDTADDFSDIRIVKVKKI